MILTESLFFSALEFPGTRRFSTMRKRVRGSTGDDDDDEAVQALESSVLTVRNCIHYSAPVEKRYVLELLKALDEASEAALQYCTYPTDAVVYLYIHSDGGDAFAGLSAMDHIRNNRVPVVTVADGFVASAATFLLLGGTERKSMRNAKILIHQLSTAFWGKYADLLDEVENSRELMESFRNVYGQHTKLRGKELDSLLKKELHMNAERSLSCGMVDEIW
jgi:ATP-dependent protease ClpP protease subunit